MSRQAETGDNGVAEKAALLSENIVKMLLMAEGSSTNIPANLLPSHQEDSNEDSGEQEVAPVKETKLSPGAFLMQELGNNIFSSTGNTNNPPHSVAALDHPELFHHCTEEDRKYYDKDAVQAIHSQDVPTLMAWHKQGRPLQTSNPFGETLLHIACRRGYLDVILFLVLEARVSLWVCDEQGKTPLHLACHYHSSEPRLLALVDVLVMQRHDPDLLFVADVRGCTPLDYAPRDTWSNWINFLREKDLRDLLPRGDVFFSEITPVPEVAATPAAAASTADTPQPQQVEAPLPFIDDIDKVLAEYNMMSKRKKKKKRSSKSRDRISNSSMLMSPGVNSVSSLEESEASPVNLKKMLTAAILEKMSLSSLADLTSLDEDTLLSTLQKQHEIGGGDYQVPRRSSTDSTSSRIDQLKELEDLKIRHIRATTSVEIALEVERQAQETVQSTQLDVLTARKEYETLAHEIQVAQDQLNGGGQQPRMQRVAESI